VRYPAPGRGRLERLTRLLAELGLEPKAAKTRIVRPTGDKDAEGFRFPGLPSPAGARADPEIGPLALPRPLALTQGDPACP
jgi:hypothetical protein